MHTKNFVTNWSHELIIEGNKIQVIFRNLIELGTITNDHLYWKQALQVK